MNKLIESPAKFAKNAFDNCNTGIKLFGNAQSQQLVANDSTLRHDEHLAYDQALIETARVRLGGIADLQAAGLVTNLGGLGTLLSMYERIGDMNDASVSMDGITEGEYDRATFDEVGVPVPIIHKDWTLQLRHLEAARQNGTNLDTTQVGLATRIVSEKLDNILANGYASMVFEGKTIYGYTTHPNRNTVSLAGSGWTVVSGRDIIGDTNKMIKAAQDDNFYGPFQMYVAGDVWRELQLDYNDNKGDKTFKERIEAFAEINSVKPLFSLPNGSVILVQMTRDVIDLAVAQDMVNLEWNNNPMQTMFKVFTAMVPRLKADKSGQCGIVHGS